MTEEIRSAALDTAAGGQIAGYQLSAEIGRGGMAIVYRAFDVRLGRTVALKILAPQLAEDESFRRRFIHESRAAAAVDHPHIVPVFEAGEADGSLFIAMRYVGTGDVRTLLEREGRLPVARAITIASQVASALDAAHARGLIHRDIKPANMLLAGAADGRADHVYLSDFGLSKQSLAPTGLTSTGQFMGTLDYVAPEQIEGKSVDGRADLYALACTTVEMLTGTPPFKRDENLALMWAQLSEPPPPPSQRRPELPSAVDQVIGRALAKSPDDRYRTCLEFAAALRAACATQPDAARSVGPAAARPMTEPSRRPGPGPAGLDHAHSPYQPDPVTPADSLASSGRLPPAGPAVPAAGLIPAESPTQAVPSVPPDRPGASARSGGPASPDDQGWPAQPRSSDGYGWLGEPRARGGQNWSDSPRSSAQPTPSQWPSSDSSAAAGQRASPDPLAPSPYGTTSATTPPTGRRRAGRRRGRAATAIGAALIAVACLAVVGFRLIHQQARGTPPSQAGQSSATSPVAALTPAQTVKAYFRAINQHRYSRAWRLGGDNTGTSYQTFVSGYSDTAHDAIEILSTSGNVVTARLVATHTDGTARTFQGTYTVSNGTIVQTNVH